MDYQKKYLKYKSKYLKLKIIQSGSGKYAYYNYNVNYEGELIGTPTLRLATSSYELLLKDDFIAVLNGKKACTCINPKNFFELFKNINIDKFNYYELLVFILNNNDITDITPENITDETSNIVLFSDIKSKQIFLNFINKYDNYIFPVGLKNIFLKTWTTIYSNIIFKDPTVYNVYIRFAIFSGIIFSYEIKDIYGFIKNQIKEHNILSIEFNKEIFFQILQDIINYIICIYNKIETKSETKLNSIKKTKNPYPFIVSSSELRLSYQRECKLYEYVTMIQDKNIFKSDNPKNFDQIDNKWTISTRYNAYLRK
jgi:hypothetical protein